MAHKNMTTQEAIEYIQNDETFDDFSFRGDDFIPEDKFNDSQYHGDDEYATSELSGVSAIFIPEKSESYIVEAIKLAAKYGKNIFLLAGENRSNMEGDYHEVLVQCHRIVGIINA